MTDPLAEAVERAARELPEGWKIEIHISTGSWMVELFDKVHREYEFDSDDCTLATQVQNAIACAHKWHRMIEHSY